MERITIVEENETYKDEKGSAVLYKTVGFYIEGDKVIFEDRTVACDSADDWTSVGSFPVENYNKGIKELIEKGCCLIKGNDLSGVGSVGCDTLKLKKISDNAVDGPKIAEMLVEVYKRYGFKIIVEFHGLRSSTTCLYCNVNKLVLEDGIPPEIKS